MENGKSKKNLLHKIKNYLRSIKENNDAFAVFVVSEGTKNLYYEDGILKNLKPNNAKDKWYFDLISSDKKYELNIDTDEVTDQMSIFIKKHIGNIRLL